MFSNQSNNDVLLVFLCTNLTVIALKNQKKRRITVNAEHRHIYVQQVVYDLLKIIVSGAHSRAHDKELTTLPTYNT